MSSINCASKTLFVGNLHASLEETDLLDIFKQFGRIVECCKRWCHYGFIQFGSEDEAKQAYLSLNGCKVRGRPMRIEFQRKKLRSLQALFESESDPCLGMNNENLVKCQFSLAMFTHQYEFKTFDSNTFNSNSNNENSNSNNKNENWEYMDIMYEKSIEKFFDDLMDDQNGTISNSRNISITNNTSSVRPLGILDMNKHLTCTKSINDSKRLRLRLSDNKENIVETAKNQFKHADKLIPDLVYSPNSIYTESLNMKTSLSSNCSSPISYRDTNSSPFGKKTFQNTSVMLFRSVNNSHTICVEPTDVLEPLNEGDFAEYKLFPNSDKKIPVQNQNSLKSLLEGLDKKAAVASSYKQQQHPSNEIHILTDYTPQSLSLSCSSASSPPSSLSNSPTNFIMQ